MKKVIALALVFCLVFTVACSSNANTGGSGSADIENSTSTISLSDEEILLQAQVLADQLLRFVLTLDKNDAASITAADVHRFAFSAGLYHPSRVGWTSNVYIGHYPYANDFLIDERGFAHYAIDKIKIAAHELFGFEKWTYDDGYNFDEEKQEYIFPLDIGFDYRLNFENMTAKIVDETTVEAHFMLLVPAKNAQGPNEWEQAAEYKITFTIITEDGKQFLRFVSLAAV